MTEPGLVLGFFRDRQAATEVLRVLRRQRFHRAATIHKPADGEVAIHQNDISDKQGALAGAACGFWLGSALNLPRTARVVPVVAGTAAGWAVARALDLSVKDETLKDYRKWVVQGETLVLVQTAVAEMPTVVSIMRQNDEGQPTIFMRRPQQTHKSSAASSEPLRQELYTAERLKEHAIQLAQQHRSQVGKGKRHSLLRRLQSNAQVITTLRQNLSDAARLEQPISLSAEWLLDNAYIIEGQIADVQRNLSRRFYAELPLLTRGPNAGVPRIYGLACELVAHTHARLDRDDIADFTTAYQTITPLKMGELWALPLMLRLALVENLRRLVVQVDLRQRERERADFWANRLLNAAHHDPDQVHSLMAALAQEQPNVRSYFADRLVSHLYDEETALGPIQSWLERKFATPLAEIIQGEQRRQTADQVLVANTITSLRVLGQLDWRNDFEQLSLVEQALRQDPSGVYSQMDFASRDRYRHEVERIARGARTDEVQVAQHVVEVATQSAPPTDSKAIVAPDNVTETPTDLRQAHVGYYLMDEGKQQTEEFAGYVAKPTQQMQRWLLTHPTPAYLGAIGLGTVLSTLALTRKAGGRSSLLLSAWSLLPASELAIQFVNYLSSKLVPPRALSKMFYEQGIPDEFRTLIVVPILMLSAEDVKEEVSRLEVHYLSNPDSNFRLALLADFRDAPAARMPGDDELLAVAVRGIEELNARYAGQSHAPLQVEPPRDSPSTPFLLFHRERSWSESEQRWMGWERKRGKLEQVNSYLCGEWDGTPEASHPVVGDSAVLEGVRFVITLDADTELPQDSARCLVETLAHPLNRPRLAPAQKPGERDRVAGGYTIIQPRVSTSLPSATATRFSRLFTDPTGSDPYTHVVSDVYQDLFGEGSYHGKGIYDLQAFHRVLSRRFPDATLLSHDLLEGAHVRVGLASDIELLDQFPPNYLTYTKREHRWIRGDWQILDWILPSVLARKGAKATSRIPNPLSQLNRWKLLDNLRRSLVPPATVLCLGIGWLGTPQSAIATGVFVAVSLLVPTLTQLTSQLVTTPESLPWSGGDYVLNLARTAISAALLPHQAALSSDAIIRVLYRRLISRRGLLEWETARASYQSAKLRENVFLLRLTGSSLFALGMGVAIFRYNPVALSAAAPFLASWAVAPLLVKWLSGGRRVAREAVLSVEDRQMLREVARQTWRYFDDFVGPQTNWLPPDNYQESLRVEIAQRTSLTNVGLWLLAILAAHDFGYLPLDEVIARALPTIKTVEQLERFQGHLLNWYDVQSQEALRPRYVSTVDTGNLVGSLWIMVQGCQELLNEPVISSNALLGLQDTLRLLEAAIAEDPAADTLHSAISELRRLFEPDVELPHEVINRLRAALAPAEQLAQSLSTRPIARKPSLRQRTDLQAKTADPRFAISTPSYWAAQIDQQLHLWIHTIDRYLGWMELLAQQPDEFWLPLGEEAVELRHEALSTAPSVEALSRGDVPALMLLLELRPQLEAQESTPLLNELNQIEDAFSRARWFAGEMLANANDLMDRLRKLSDELDMRLLYDEKRKLFSIGFNAEEMRLDGSYYDLIATECRIASFAAIARGDVPVEHWLTLGRRFGDVNGRLVLLSWTGTMFEYLMPLLFMQAFENSLLDLGCKAAVARQIEYGRQQGVPWGISESAFSALDTNKIYQYKAFGVPGLGLKRGLEDDLVVAPYATALALLVDTDAALENLKRLEKLGMRGDYGFYESIDFSRASIGDPDQDGASVPARNGQAGKREANSGVIVRAFMVHHQGMSLLAFDNLLHHNVMQRRFHADPYARAATPLLYERIPPTPPVLEESADENRPRRFALDSQATGVAEDRLVTPDTPTPRTHLLSNGNYSLMITNAGGGYSLWHDMEITRWRADTTRDNWGSFIYLRDVESGVVWSATHQPVRRAARFTSIAFNADHAEFRRQDAEIETLLEVLISPEDDVEIRRVILTNHSTRTRRIELTSYAELALAPHNADRAHPAFSKLFVQTEALPDKGMLLAWRRPRSPQDPSIWAGHLAATDEPVQNAQYETDRAQFLGRGRTAENPVALEGELSNTAGAVLDPIFSLRRSVALKPGQRVEVAFMTAAAATREEVIALLEKYADVASAQRTLDMAWTHAQLEMHHLRIQAEDGLRFQQLASYMLYPSLALRAPARRLRENRLSQQGLWAHSISGDLPIMVVTIDNVRDIGTVRQALLAHTYWHIRGFKADLVVLNDQGGSYEQDLSEELKKLIQSHAHYTGMDQPGGVFLRPASNLSQEDLTLILESARVLLVAARGSLAQQLSVSVEQPQQSPRLALTQRPAEEPSAPLPFMELPYFNGLGGFTVDGREYAIYLGPRQRTPAPWVNVMANPQFGTLVTETGQGYSWYGNSQANKLTPWSNDPVSDPATEAIYIRDEDSGVFWTPTPLPVRELDAYRTRHGQGYTLVEHNSHAIEQELVTFVPVDDNGGLRLRLQRLRLRNRSSRRRRLTITSYQEWVLGTTREEMQPHVVTAWDSQNHILLARNSYQQDFGNCSAFLSSSPLPATFTADRTLFMGRNSSPANPTAMRRKSLVERVGAGLDPCGAVQVMVELEPGQDTEVTFMLGQVPDVEQAQQMVKRFRSPAQVEEALRRTREWWDNLLGTLQVEVPDLGVNFLLNRWLPYQTLSCRIWGRSAFYQSGGAYGFRDQLQDVMAFLPTMPQVAREQILRAAAHQFVEGDVQHWWHPPSDAGVRTRFSDDLLWLPYVVAHYVRATGDSAILDEQVGFLQAPVLTPEQHEQYIVPQHAPNTATLFEHCRRAITKGLTSGAHGLPLIGIGDWNDGMSRVGVEGKGESVWLAWFLIDVLNGFADLCEERGDNEQAKTYHDQAAHLAATVEANAWDGDWYVRAYFDDGTPLGSHTNEEAKIDSIAQSWGVISGAARPERVDSALRAVEQYLVRKDDKMILLYTPPFDKSPHDPGYIKGYLPGVRENGGQYTHAAIWTALAFARRGDGDKAVELLRMLNPVEHTRTEADVQRYKVEPYVVAADVYALEGQVGRGGWTWYTGSSSWMYRVWIESVLGFRLQGQELVINPTIPADWKEFKLHYRYHSAWYGITVENPDGVNTGVAAVEVDGILLNKKAIPLQDDGARHDVRVRMGKEQPNQ